MLLRSYPNMYDRRVVFEPAPELYILLGNLEIIIFNYYRNYTYKNINIITRSLLYNEVI